MIAHSNAPKSRGKTEIDDGWDGKVGKVGPSVQ